MQAFKQAAIVQQLLKGLSEKTSKTIVLTIKQALYQSQSSPRPSIHYRQVVEETGLGRSSLCFFST